MFLDPEYLLSQINPEHAESIRSMLKVVTTPITFELHCNNVAVAQGAEFGDGTCVLRWLSEHRSTVIYASRKALIAVHGHEGATTLYDTGAPYERGMMDAWQDRCENATYQSVGGQSWEEPKEWRAPKYIVEREWVPYLDGYRAQMKKLKEESQ